MRIFAISDLHISGENSKPMEVFGKTWENYLEKIFADWNARVSADDVVLIAGDLSWAMKLEDGVKDISILADLPGKKVFIRGNHDYWWSGITRIRSLLPDGFYCIQNDCIKFDNLIITGSRGWTLEGSSSPESEDMRLCHREAERLKMAFFNCSKLRGEGDKLVCMMHYPPFNVSRDNSMFTDLFEVNKVDAVVYGHLHGKDCKADPKITKNSIVYYLTSCDQVNNKLVEIVV